MAKLNENLIRSMVWDLKEIIQVCAEITTSGLTFDCISWRYPLQTCHSVDILAILNQPSENPTLDYIRLLELIYDRMLFALHMLITIIDNIPATKNRFMHNIFRPPNLTLGAGVKMMWCRIKSLQVLLSEMNTTKDNTTIENISQETLTITTNTLQRGEKKPNGKVSKYSQTDVHSLVACESCDVSHDLMRSLIEEIGSCNSDCFAAISAMRERMKEKLYDMSHLSAMRSWVDALRAEVRKLVIANQKLTSINVNLKSAISEKELIFKNKCITLENCTNDLKRKCEELQSLLLLEETKHTKSVDCIKELEVALAKQHNVEERLRENLNKLEITTAEYKKESTSLYRDLIEAHKSLQLVEEEKVICKKERDDWKLKFDHEKNISMMANKLRGDEAVKLSEMMTSFEEQVTELKKTHNQERSLVLEQLMNLKKNDSEKQNLIKILQSEKGHLSETLAAADHQCKNLELQVSKLCEKLDKCLKGGNKRLENLDDQRPAKQYRVRGNPIEDMESQVQANTLQIKLLEEENCRLAKTIHKLKQLPGKNVDILYPRALHFHSID